MCYPPQVIGGNTSATDAAYLSEYFLSNEVKTNVVCVPCTISGGMKNNFVVSYFALSFKISGGRGGIVNSYICDCLP